MLRKIILNIINIIGKVFKKRIVFVNEKTFLLNNTAVLSEYGFWYAGNVFDMADISYGIVTKGSVERDETKLVIKILNHISEKENISVYDIGANTGYYGILSAFMFKEKVQVYSFEPVLEHVDCIKKSIYLNKLNNLKIFELGLGNKDEEKTMYIAGSGSSFEKGFTAKNIKNERKILINKLDNIVSNEKIKKPDFIKMDVEGHEFKVLEGAKNTISGNLPVLFIEIAYSMKNLGRSYINNDFKNTFDFLENMGYQSYKFDGGKLQKINSEKKPDGIYMYLFLHKNKHSKLKNDIINEKFS